MSQTKARRFDIPGKVFILGEYAVLAGLPAVVATVPPRFQLIKHSSVQTPFATFAPCSPAGCLLKFASKILGDTPHLQFVDSTQGGFGASTAQFALAYLALAREAGWETGWKNVWSLYRDLTGGQPMSPSGADLIAQWQGGVSIVDPAESGLRPVTLVTDAFVAMDWSSVLIFSATNQPGRKVPTHSHLGDLVARGFQNGLPGLASRLAEPLLAGISAIREGRKAALGKAMGDYASLLRAAGLECDQTFDDRMALSTIPGVLGVKGAGALQADALVVLLDHAGLCDREAVIRSGQARGLVCVADGISHQTGIAGQ